MKTNSVWRVIQNYLNGKIELYEKTLNFIESEYDLDRKYQQIISMVVKENIHKNKEEGQLFLSLLAEISANHHRNPHFFQNIEKLILFFKQTFTNEEIIHIFIKSKSIMLYFIQNRIISFDEYEKYTNSSSILTIDQKLNNFYKSQFSNLNEKVDETQFGENNSEICTIIRKDLIKEFVNYVNRTEISLKYEIKSSTNETNQFLIGKHPTLIEYSAFFGSIRIFRYLIMRKVKLLPTLWLYAIHSNNPKIIHILENECIFPKDKTSSSKCLFEAIKCHHNNIATYIINNKLNLQNNNEIIEYSLSSYNFKLLPIEDINNANLIFYQSITKNYIQLVSILVNNGLLNCTTALVNNFIDL